MPVVRVVTVVEFEPNNRLDASDGKESTTTPEAKFVEMQHTHQLDAIRDLVISTFVEFTQAEVEFSESVLIRDGFYCGRRFTSDRVRAVWFAEDNVVKFYGQDGEFLVAREVTGAAERVSAGEPVQRRQAA